MFFIDTLSFGYVEKELYSPKVKSKLANDRLDLCCVWYSSHGLRPN